jgi:hypothetical protein
VGAVPPIKPPSELLGRDAASEKIKEQARWKMNSLATIPHSARDIHAEILPGMTVRENSLPK